MDVLAISGSLRVGSSNAALLRVLAGMAPATMRFTFYEQEMASLPPFNPDLDGEGAVSPPAVDDLRTRLGAADAVVISSPEYAHGAPGVLKNALDWIVSSGELEEKPLALLAAAPGGGAWSQAVLTPTLEVMGARIVFSAAFVFTRTHVDDHGRIADPEIRTILGRTLDALIASARPT